MFSNTTNNSKFTANAQNVRSLVRLMWTFISIDSNLTKCYVGVWLWCSIYWMFKKIHFLKLWNNFLTRSIHAFKDLLTAIERSTYTIWRMTNAQRSTFSVQYLEGYSSRLNTNRIQYSCKIKRTRKKKN